MAAPKASSRKSTMPDSMTTSRRLLGRLEEATFAGTRASLQLASMEEGLKELLSQYATAATSVESEVIAHASSSDTCLRQADIAQPVFHPSGPRKDATPAEACRLEPDPELQPKEHPAAPSQASVVSTPGGVRTRRDDLPETPSPLPQRPAHHHRRQLLDPESAPGLKPYPARQEEASQAELARLRTEVQNRTGGDAEAEALVAELRNELSTLRSQLHFLSTKHKRQLVESDAAAKTAQLEKAEAVAEVQCLRFQLDERAGAASSARLEAEGLRRNVAELEGQVASQRQQLMEAIDLARQEQSYSRELEVEVTQLKQRLQDKALAASQARAEAEGLRRQVAEMGGQMEEQRRQLLEVVALARQERLYSEELEDKMQRLQSHLDEKGGGVRHQVLHNGRRELPKKLPVYFDVGQDTISGTLVLDSGMRGGRGAPDITILCDCNACGSEPTLSYSPTQWLAEHGHASKDWSKNIKVDLDRFPEVQLGSNKESCSVGKFFNLHGFDWDRARTKGESPRLIPAFRS